MPASDANPYQKYRLAGLAMGALPGMALLIFGSDVGAATMGLGAIISGITSYFHPTVPRGGAGSWGEAQAKAAMGPDNIIKSVSLFGALLLGVGAILLLRSHM